MAFADKLKPSLSTNISKTLTMHKRGKEYDNKFKPGEKQYHYIFRDETGKEYSHYANERENEYLGACNPGDSMNVVLEDMVIEKDGVSQRITFLKWGTKGSSEMEAAPQLKSNTAIKTAEKKQDEYDLERKRKDKSIGLRGLFQSHVSAGKTNLEAMKLAIEADNMIEGYVNTIPF